MQAVTCASLARLTLPTPTFRVLAALPSLTMAAVTSALLAPGAIICRHELIWAIIWRRERLSGTRRCVCIPARSRPVACNARSARVQTRSRRPVCGHGVLHACRGPGGLRGAHARRTRLRRQRILLYSVHSMVRSLHHASRGCTVCATCATYFTVQAGTRCSTVHSGTGGTWHTLRLKGST